MNSNKTPVEIHKFGGGVLNNVAALKQMKEIVKSHILRSKIVIVVSAFGKTTNNLEKLVDLVMKGDSEKTNYMKLISDIRKFHKSILKEFSPDEYQIKRIDRIMDLLPSLIKQTALFGNLNFIKDQVLPLGEIMASEIVAQCLDLRAGNFINAFNIFETDLNFGEANIKIINIDPITNYLDSLRIFVTQGFIAGATLRLSPNLSLRCMTTLGREGSDYTAGILGNALDAQKVILWKNVPGIMDFDPNKFGDEDNALYEEIAYAECRELLDGPAKGIIHPKTLAEVEKKKIPLHVKDFWHPKNPGTVIC